MRHSKHAGKKGGKKATLGSPPVSLGSGNAAAGGLFPAKNYGSGKPTKRIPVRK